MTQGRPLAAHPGLEAETPSAFGEAQTSEGTTLVEDLIGSLAPVSLREKGWG
jgi:hypothetical protein